MDLAALLNGDIVLPAPKGKFLSEQLNAFPAFRNAPVIRRAFLAVVVAASVASCATPPPNYAVTVCVENEVLPGVVVHTLDNGNTIINGKCQ